MMDRNPMLLLLIFLYGLVLHSNQYFISIIVFIIIVFLILALPKYGFIFYLITVIISPDLIVNKTYTGEVIIRHSIFLDSINGITFITLISIYILIISFIRKPNIEFNKLILFTIFLPLIIPLYGILTTNNVPEFISSSSYIFVLLAIFFLLNSVNIDKELITKLFYYSIIITMIINILITLLNGFTLVYWGSLCYIFPIVLLINYKNRSVKVDILLILLIIANLLIFPARGRVLTFLILLFVFLVLKMSVRNLIKLISSVLFITLVSIFLYKYVLPDEMNSYLEWKLTTIDPTDSDNKSSNIRLIEFQNIIYGSFNKIYPIFIGEGYGGYFVDNYVPFNISELLDADAFKEEWIQNRTFYRPHTVFNILLLKAGLVPTLVLYSSLFYLTYYLFRKFRKSKPNNMYLIVLPLLAFVMYTQKLQIIFAILLYILSKEIKKNKSPIF